MLNNLLISQTYISLFPRLAAYIGRRIADMEYAYDVAQDVFMRLLRSDIVLRCAEAVEALAFSIARRIIIDIYRHRVAEEKMLEQYAVFFSSLSDETESGILARDMENLEMRKMETLSLQRKAVYRMRRFEGLSNDEIAMRLSLSKRTVENHSFCAIHEMRDFMRKCV